VRDQRQLERPALVALLRGTYRGKRFSEAARVVGLDRMVVTLASDCVLFSRRA
jgi:hypothetical protein